MRTIALLTGVLFLETGAFCSVRATDIDLGVEVSEIMYDTPNNADTGGEWIEIHNNTGGALNIDGWQIYDGNNWRTIHQWPGYADITSIPNGSYAVIAEPPGSSYSFPGLYPDFSGYLGQTDGVLSLLNDGDVLVLKDAAGTVYQDFQYPDNVTNRAMIKYVIFGDEDDETIWRPASQLWGTPGEMDTGADQSLPITLSSFTAGATNGTVTLRWTTETEVDNRGFNIWRADSANGQYSRVNPELIPGAQTSAAPQTYTYQDKTVQPGHTYWYKLEQLDISGASEFFGPIAVTVADQNDEPQQGLVPLRTELLGSYPNPFNPKTTVSFSLAQAQEVYVTVYDICGRRVRTLVGGHVSEGMHAVPWDGTSDFGIPVPGGVYLCRMRCADGFVSTIKLVRTR